MVKLPERPKTDLPTPRKAGARTSPPGTFPWMDALDLVGSNLYPKDWTRLETQNRADDLEWSITKERMRRVGRSRLAALRCQQGPEVARAYLHPPLDEDGLPLPIFADLPDVPDVILQRAASRAERATRILAAEVHRWSATKAWLKERLWSGTVIAVVWNYSSGMSPRIAKHFWGSQAGDKAVGTGSGTLLARDLSENMLLASLAGALCVEKDGLFAELDNILPRAYVTSNYSSALESDSNKATVSPVPTAVLRATYDGWFADQVTALMGKEPPPQTALHKAFKLAFPESPLSRDSFVERLKEYPALYRPKRGRRSGV